jgi:hypothetical protein
MKRLLAVLVLALAGSAWSQTLFSDPFNGTVIDSSKWSVYLPFTNSTASVQGGALRSVNRGTIVANQDFTSPYILSGTFRHSSIYDVTSIYLRSDGQRTSTDVYGGLTGVGISFWSPYNYYGVGDLHVGTSDDISSPVATYAQSFNWNVDYTFSILDTGESLNIKVTGADISPIDWIVPITFSKGTKIALASRENAFHPSQTGVTDFLDIQVSIPEPSSLSLLLAGGAVALAGRRKSE